MTRMLAGLTSLCFGMVLLTGCGPSTGNIKGTVKVNGQLLDKGVITFYPEIGKETAPVAAHVLNGEYKVSGILQGTYRIAVTPAMVETPLGEAKGSSRPLKPGEVDKSGNTSGGLPKSASSVFIPEKFRSPDTSELSVKVDQAEVEHPVDLK